MKRQSVEITIHAALLGDPALTDEQLYDLVCAAAAGKSSGKIWGGLAPGRIFIVAARMQRFDWSEQGFTAKALEPVEIQLKRSE